MDKREFELKFEDYLAKFFRVYQHYIEENPQCLEASTLQLVRVAVKHLQTDIEEIGADEPDWARVSGMVPWPVDFDEEMLPRFFVVRPRDLRDRKTIAKAILRHFTGFKALATLWQLTRGVVVSKKDDEYEVTYPPDLWETLEKMPKAKRRKAEKSLLHPEAFSFDLSVPLASNAKVRETGSVSLNVMFEPLYADLELKEAFYPINIDLKIQSPQPWSWGRRNRAKFWESLLREIALRIPEESYEFLRKVVEDSRLKEVRIRKLVRPEWAGDFAELLQSYADFQADQREKTGHFMAVKGSFDLNRARLRPTQKQEKDYKKHDYKCYVTIEISGETPRKKSNRVVVNGKPVTVPDYLLPLLLRLVVELRKGKGGWVNVKTLADEKIVNAPDDYRWYNRLRDKLGSGLPRELDGALVQNDGSGNYRLSTHPDSVTYDKRKLLNHPKADVQRIARMLPRYRKPKQ